MSEKIGKFMNFRSTRPTQQSQSTILLDETEIESSKNKLNNNGGYTLLIILCVCIVIITLLISFFVYKVNKKVQVILDMSLAPIPAQLMPTRQRFARGIRNPQTTGRAKFSQNDQKETKSDQPQNPDLEYEMPEEESVDQKEVSIDIDDDADKK